MSERKFDDMSTNAIGKALREDGVPKSINEYHMHYLVYWAGAAVPGHLIFVAGSGGRRVRVSLFSVWVSASMSL